VKEVLSPAERAIMETTFRVTMRRAANVAAAITESDVLDMQANLLAAGCPLERVAKVDRLMLAVAHLRACAETGGTNAKADALARELVRAL
jgi:hypothetical protein